MLPGFALIGALGTRWVREPFVDKYRINNKYLRNAIFPVLSVFPITEIWLFFPHNYAYLNEFTRFIYRGRVHEYFEPDYYGFSNIYGVQWLSANTTGPIRVCVFHSAHTAWHASKRKVLKLTCKGHIAYVTVYGRFFNHDKFARWLKKRGIAESPTELELVTAISAHAVEVQRIFKVLADWLRCFRQPRDHVAKPVRLSLEGAKSSVLGGLGWISCCSDSRVAADYLKLYANQEVPEKRTLKGWSWN
jgi:hypothetical protein